MDMLATPITLAAEALALGFTSLEEEIREGRELAVRGTLPPDLQGTLYRIGPGRHDVYGERAVSWFDGDGMVHALTLEEGRVSYRNRFVETAGKAEEDRAQRKLYGGFGSRTPGSAWRRLLRRGARKNPANTNIVFHGGKLLALCEAGKPYRLDPVTLATVGEDDLGALADGAYSAHPKLDPRTGEMWNFGTAYGRESTVSLYRTTAEGVTTKVTTLALPAPAMVHDFAITATRAIFVIAPIVLPRIPLGLVLGQRSFGESLHWRPELGVRIAVVDRASGEARWVTTDPFMLFHTAHAWDEGDDVVVDLCAYPDGAIMRTIVDIMVGDTPTPARCYPERLRITQSGVSRTRLSATPMEFPRVAGRAWGQSEQRIYGTSWSDGLEFIGKPVAIDVATGRAEEAAIGAGEYAGECVPVAKAGATSERDVWLLTLVLDGASRTSELRILDGGDLAAPPVARVRLPHVVPFGFHGNWVSRARLAAPTSSSRVEGGEEKSGRPR